MKLLTFFLCLFLLSCASQPKKVKIVAPMHKQSMHIIHQISPIIAKPIQWQDPRASFTRGLEQNKLILMYISMENCPACERLNTLFAEQEIADIINEYFIPIKPDRSEELDTAIKSDLELDRMVYPIIIIVDGDSNIYGSIIGAPTKEQLESELAITVAQHTLNSKPENK